MVTTITGRHMDVSAPLKSYAEQKVGKLPRYFDRIQEIEVIFDHSNGLMQVEVIVNAEQNHVFVAHHADDDAYAAIDACIDKLERQLTDHKKRVRNRKHPAG